MSEVYGNKCPRCGETKPRPTEPCMLCEMTQRETDLEGQLRGLIGKVREVAVICDHLEKKSVPPVADEQWITTAATEIWVHGPLTRNRIEEILRRYAPKDL